MAEVVAQNILEILINSKDNTSETVKNVQRNIEQLANKLQQIGKQWTTIGGAGVAAMTGMVRSTVMYAETVDKLNKTTGLSTDFIQEMIYAAEQEHGSIEGLTTGFKMLSRNMYDASKGTGEAKDVFEMMGISVTNADGTLRNLGDVMLEVADWFKASNDEAAKSAIALKLFGRSGSELVPFLELGSVGIQELRDEFRQTGRMMSGENVRDLKLFSDEVLILTTVLKGIKDQISVSLIPFLKDMVKTGIGILQWFRELSPETKEFLAKLFLIGSAGMVAAGGLLLFTSAILRTINGTMALTGFLQKLGSLGVANIGALTSSMIGFISVVALAISLMEIFTAFKGMKQAKETKNLAESRMKELEAIERDWKAGRITKEEALARMKGGAERFYGATPIAGAYSATYGMSALQKTSYEIGRLIQIQADMKFVKEEELPQKLNTVLGDMVTNYGH